MVKATNSGKTVAQRSGNCKVDIFRNGAVMHAKLPAGNPSGKGAPQGRGKVSVWSRSSRKRMRDFLMRYRLPETHEGYSVTLTIPGPVITPIEAKELFRRYTDLLTKSGCCSVWRVEIQPTRKMLHWHCVIGAPRDRRPYGIDMGLMKMTKREREIFNAWAEMKKTTDDPWSGLKDGTWYNAALLQDKWLTCLSHLEGGEYRGNYYPVEVWPGARKRSCVAELLQEDDAGWMRYMLDHATKVKQAQIPDNIGRHWGKTGKKLFVELEPETHELTPAQYDRFRRARNRLAQGMRQEPKAPFGTKKGTKRHAGRVGTYCTFGSPETYRRLVVWASKTTEKGVHD